MSTQYQSACSANVVGKVLQGCSSHKKPSERVQVWTSTLSPTPNVIPTNNNGTGGSCDCTYNYGGDTSTSGSNWSNILANGPGETWQNNAHDLLTLQNGNWSLGDYVDYGVCNTYGFKAVTGRKGWHGCFGFLSNDACLGTQSIAADQTKYLSWGVNYSYNLLTYGEGPGSYTSIIGGGGGTLTVGQDTGLINGQQATHEDSYLYDVTDGTNTQYYHIVNGVGWNETKPILSGGKTAGDGTYTDLHCANLLTLPAYGIWMYAGQGLDGFVANINSASANPPRHWSGSFSQLPDWSDPNSYSGATAQTQTIVEDYGPSGYNPGTEWTVTTTNVLDVSVAWSRNNTGISWNISYTNTQNTVQVNGPSDYNLWEKDVWSYSGTMTLGTPYTAQQAAGQAAGLLSQWDLNDNTQYQWRHDDYTSFNPQVGLREIQGNISPITPFRGYYMFDYRTPVNDANGNAPWTTNDTSLTSPWVYSPNNNDCNGDVSGSNPAWGGPCAWMPTYANIPYQDSNAYSWQWDTSDGYSAGMLASALLYSHIDGTVIGGPAMLPYINTSGSRVYGPQYNYFDFYGDQINFCDQPQDSGCSGPSYEQWTIFHGGTINMRYVSVPGSETGPQLGSFLPPDSTHWNDNCAAHIIPRGASIVSGYYDHAIYVTKWAETMLPYKHINYFRPCGADRFAVIEPSASNFTTTPMIMTNQLGGLSGGSEVLIYGTGNDGVFSGCGQTDNGDGTFTLTTGSLVSPLPTGFSRPFGYSYGMAGIIRWTSAMPICGRVQVTTIASGSSTLINFLAPQPYMRTGDSIDLYNQTYSSSYTNLSVTRVDDSNFAVNQVDSGSMLHVIYAQSHGSPDYNLNDTSRKLEYRYSTWNTNGRTGVTSGGGCTQDCLPISPCAPSICNIEPGISGTPTSSFQNGKTITFDPNDFTADDLYGSVTNINCEFCMPDPFWQMPLIPTDAPGITRDNGSCNLSDESTTYYWEPQVEAVCSFAATVPTDVTIPPMTQPYIPGVIGYSYSFNGYEPWIIYGNQIANCGVECYLSPDEAKAC
jgi:hypothetical protein